MKTMLCIPLALLLSPTELSFAQNYAAGDTLHVVAHSGLRLRTSPQFDAGTIRILSYGEEVRIMDTYGFAPEYRSTSGWMSGAWVKVSVRGIEGYAHDSYLSTLRLPSHEDELCDDTQYLYPALEAYLSHHYPATHDHNGSEHREDTDQCITYHTGGITLTRTLGTGWQKTDIQFEQTRAVEVVNLLRSMLIGDDLRNAFEDSLRFFKDKQSRITRIQAGVGRCTIQISIPAPHTVHMSFTEFVNG